MTGVEVCLRCGREGHTADECTRPVPSWPARDGDEAAESGERPVASRNGNAGPSGGPTHTGRNDREIVLAAGPGKG